MAIAIDASSPARWTGTPANTVNITSSSFTPPNNSLIVLCVQADTEPGNSNADITISVSGGSLTWTEQVQEDEGTNAAIDASSEGGHSGIWTAPVGTGASMTISVNRSAGTGGTNRITCKAYVVTGQNASPIGNTGKNISTTNDLTASIFTSSASNSFAFVSASDWSQLGTPVSSDLTEDAADYVGQISAISGYKDCGSSGAETANLDAGAGTPFWVWTALEIKESSSAPNVYEIKIIKQSINRASFF